MSTESYAYRYSINLWSTQENENNQVNFEYEKVINDNEDPINTVEWNIFLTKSSKINYFTIKLEYSENIK